MPKVLTVVLAGGSGSRLWPVSRKNSPKPFLKIDDDSILQKTVKRIAALKSDDYLFVINDEHLFKLENDIERTNIDFNYSIITEPIGRDSAPAIATAALYARDEMDEETILFVVPADHLIDDTEKFAQAYQEAVELAQQDLLVTMGLKPLYAHTGYGYIKFGQSISGNGFAVEQFVEKPSDDKAMEYLQSGQYLWNCGIFCFKAKSIIQELQAREPELLENCDTAWRSNKIVKNAHRLQREDFEKVKAISVDYAVMEYADNIAVVKSDFQWHDLGCWNVLANQYEVDGDGNTFPDNVIPIDTSNSYISSSKDKVIGVVGLDNVVIADTDDALLICHKDRTQEVKKIFKKLEEIRHPTIEDHKTVYRPWGSFTTISEGKGFKVKRITVNPEQSLSLQLHHKRSEHWVVVSGHASVINGEQNLELRANEHVYIPVGNKHRLTNLDKDKALIIIETQLGDYLGEDDIVRFNDIYGRA